MTRASLLAVLGSLALSASASGDAGREFFAVYSYREGNLWPLSILACNPDPVTPANVVVDTESGVVGGAAVPPGSCEVVLVSDLRKASTTILARLAYRVRSDRPIFAQQFTNFEFNSAYPSATRLPDRTELGTEYVVLAMTAGFRDTEPSVVVVVAPEPSRVSVTVTGDTAAGGGVPALTAGTTYTTDLPAFGVLQLASVPDADLTGSIVTSDVPVQVFGGCITCFVSTSPTSDGTFEAIPPASTWRTRYAVPATYPTTVAPNLIRVLARDDGTIVTSDPAQLGTPVALNRGDYLDLVTTADFVIDASAPVLVGRVEGRGNRDPSDRMGDPALVLLLPEEQFFNAATFSLPKDWNAVEEWVDVVTYVGSIVRVDGNVVPASNWLPIGSSSFVHASIRLTFGLTHSVSADMPLAAYAGARHAYSAASYAVDVGCQAPVPPEVSQTRSPLWLARRGADVLFSWEDVGPSPSRYNVYAGTIGSIWDHASLSCGVSGAPIVGGRREAILAVPSSGYFLVSASNCDGEGATGGDPARSDCP